MGTPRVDATEGTSGVDATEETEDTSAVAATVGAARVDAAGALPWRDRDGRLEVALVHRPRYDDWSWPKGKLDPGEEWPVAAVREVAEETGLVVRLGRPLPRAAYTVVHRGRGPENKRVRYWAAEVVGGDGTLTHEVDAVAWLDVAAAAERLSHARDRDQLWALALANGEQTLRTWPLALVRHAKAVRREDWPGEDPLRPLDDRGEQRAVGLVPLLAAYGVTLVVSSPSARCAESVRPYAVEVGRPLRLKPGLSEEGHAATPGRAPHHLVRLLERGEPAALCSHRTVLPGLLDRLATMADGYPEAASALTAAARGGMGKGEALVAHLVGAGHGARVVAVERHLP